MRVTYFLPCILLLAGCATKTTAPKSASSAAFAFTQSAKVQVAKARAAVERIKSESPVVYEATLALDRAETSIAEASDRIESLQTQITEANIAREDAAQKARDAEGAVRFWRAATLKLTLLSIALGLWVFRKPILRLCGVPAL